MNGRVPRPHSLQHGASHTGAAVPDDSPELSPAHGTEMRRASPADKPQLADIDEACLSAGFMGWCQAASHATP